MQGSDSIIQKVINYLLKIIGDTQLIEQGKVAQKMQLDYIIKTAIFMNLFIENMITLLNA